MQALVIFNQYMMRNTVEMCMEYLGGLGKKMARYGSRNFKKGGEER